MNYTELRKKNRHELFILTSNLITYLRLQGVTQRKIVQDIPDFQYNAQRIKLSTSLLSTLNTYPEKPSEEQEKLKMVHGFKVEGILYKLLRYYEVQYDVEDNAWRKNIQEKNNSIHKIKNQKLVVYGSIAIIGLIVFLFLGHQKIQFKDLIKGIITLKTVEIGTQNTHTEFTDAQKKDVVFYTIKNLNSIGLHNATIYLHVDVSRLKLSSYRIVVKGEFYGDSVVINQPTKERLSIVFERPGVKGIGLWVNGQLLKSISVAIPAKDWTAWENSLASEGGINFIANPRETKTIINDGCMYLPMELIPDKPRRYYFSTYIYSQNFDVDPKDFTIEARVKKLYDEKLISNCRTQQFFIKDKKGHEFSFPLLNKGCNKWLSVLLPEDNLSSSNMEDRKSVV